MPPSDNVFEYIVFRGSDVKDLKIEEAAKKVEPPPPRVPDDPAILAVSLQPFGFDLLFDEQLRIYFLSEHFMLIFPLPSF